MALCLLAMLAVKIRTNGLMLIEGEAAELICDKTFPYVTNDLDIPMKWSLEGKSMGECSFTGCQSSVHMANANTSLVFPINSAQRSVHSGRWTCEQFLVISYGSDSVDLDVKVPVKSVVLSPAADDKTGQLNVIQLQSVFIGCESSESLPSTTITWHVINSNPGTSLTLDVTQEQPKTTGDGLFITSSKATFTPKRENHGSRIYCKGKNIDSKPVVESQYVTLNVLVPVPGVYLSTIHNDFTDVFVKDGEESSLTCTTEAAAPAPKIEWIASKQETYVYFSHEPLPAVLTADGLYISSSKLTFAVTKVTAGETIYCTARNTVGQEQTSYRGRLNVQYRPKATAWLYYTELPRVGGNVELKCSAESNPEATLKWSKQGEFLPNGDVLYTGKNLLITNLSCRDAGMYICWAENSAYPEYTDKTNVTLDGFPCVPSVPSELTIKFTSTSYMRVGWKTENEFSLTTYVVQIRGAGGSWETIFNQQGKEEYMDFQYSTASLEAKMVYDLRIQATNSIGKSPGYLTGEFTLPEPTSDINNDTIILAAVISSVALVAIIIVVAVVIFCIRRKKRRRGTDNTTKTQNEGVKYNVNAVVNQPTDESRNRQNIMSPSTETDKKHQLPSHLPHTGGVVFRNPSADGGFSNGSASSLSKISPNTEIDKKHQWPSHIPQTDGVVFSNPSADGGFSSESASSLSKNVHPYIEVLPEGILIRNPSTLPRTNFPSNNGVSEDGGHIHPSAEQSLGDDGYLRPVREELYAEIDEDAMY